MISFAVDPRFIEDLEDDFVMNETLTLYEFINNDPVKAFYLGIYLDKWFKKINRNQRYLYSKQARHNNDDIRKYDKQIEFWQKKFPEEGEIDLAKVAEYIINNIFWEEKTEDLDRVKMAFFLGDIIATEKCQQDTQKESQKEK